MNMLRSKIIQIIPKNLDKINNELHNNFIWNIHFENDEKGRLYLFYHYQGRKKE